MIVAGHQPNYLPWLGFFHKMKNCDVFTIEDNLQFVYREFHNRNRIKTPNGIRWLTVPIHNGRKRQPICDVKICNNIKWQRKHWLTLQSSYGRAPYWHKYEDFFRETYNKKWDRLIDLNLHLIMGIRDFLKIKTKIVFASELEVSGKKNELILAQLKALGADTLLSGTGALDYLNFKLFKDEGIKVMIQDFKHPTYTQLWGKFVPNLSVVDFLFCTGGKEPF